MKSNNIWLQVSMNDKQMCRYSYSTNGKNFTSIGSEYRTEKGTWIGAKVGIASLNPHLLSSKGYADFDYFKVSR